MTCQHCCGAESIFDQKSAEKDLNRYKRKGPNKTTRILLNMLTRNGVEGMSLLDIGGGVGVIQHELLKAGVIKTSDVDASTSYQTMAKQIAKDNDTLDRMNFIHGDFIDHASEIEKHDIVTLERVVCCYPDVHKLIQMSTDNANMYYCLVYPRDNFLSRALIKMTHLYFWIKRNPFRTFVHSEKNMYSLIKKQGFELVRQDNAFIWRVVVFKRSSL